MSDWMQELRAAMEQGLAELNERGTVTNDTLRNLRTAVRDGAERRAPTPKATDAGLHDYDRAHQYLFAQIVDPKLLSPWMVRDIERLAADFAAVREEGRDAATLREAIADLAREMRGFGRQRFNDHDDLREELCEMYANKIEVILDVCRDGAAASPRGERLRDAKRG